MNKIQKNNTFSVTFTAAARRLGVSLSTVQRLVRKGTLHTTEPQLRRHHWTRGIRVDKAFEAERARRLHGLKAPRRKKIVPNPNPNPNRKFNPADPSPIQTFTPNEMLQNEYYGLYGNIVLTINSEYTHATLEKCRNAMNICLEAQKACDRDMQECRSRAAECKGESAHVDEAANYVVTAKVECWRRERTCARCAAILAAVCILQILFGVFYILCNHNII